MFYSYAKQDEFVDLLLNHKKDGFYVDIGSCNGVDLGNNSYFFESKGWKGLCVELDSSYNSTYTERSCRFINGNALSLDYSLIFREMEFPTNIDYLSIDIDELSSSVLQVLPFSEYNFKIITIEHDLYLRGESYKNSQTDFLTSKGYFAVCENVFVEQEGYYNQRLPFEDWWISSEHFDQNFVESIRNDMEYPSSIISKIKKIKS